MCVSLGAQEGKPSITEEWHEALKTALVQTDTLVAEKRREAKEARSGRAPARADEERARERRDRSRDRGSGVSSGASSDIEG
jgi:hypothetical protein